MSLNPPPFLLLLLLLPLISSFTTLNSKPTPKNQPTPMLVFREYIGAEFTNVSFTDVPINPNLNFHFILAFAIDYTTSTTSPSPTNGNFTPFWDSSTLSPSAVSLFKKQHPNVTISLSLGGDSVNGQPAFFKPVSLHSWVANAVSSLTLIIQQFNLDGIDIDYEHFDADPHIFAECMGRLVQTLKKDGIISTASIAPFADPMVQRHYMRLWKKHGHLFDYVNFQFYAYDNSTTVKEFLGYFEEQRVNYEGGKVLVSFISDWSKGLTFKNGFFEACKNLLKKKLLHGIFVWCADESKNLGFRYETIAQNLLAGSM